MTPPKLPSAEYLVERLLLISDLKQRIMPHELVDVLKARDRAVLEAALKCADRETRGSISRGRDGATRRIMARESKR